jgi:hypothetical protein
MFYIDLGIFQKIPIYLVSNFFWQKKLSVSVSDFPGATGHETELGNCEELDNFHTNKCS